MPLPHVDPKFALLAALALIAVGYIVVALTDLRRRRAAATEATEDEQRVRAPTPTSSAPGGSSATSTFPGR